MGATDRFRPDEVQRILALTEKQLEYWDRLQLVSPRKEKGSRSYDFRDLISLRTVKQLIEEGVPANRIRRAVAALRAQLSHVQSPLAELRVLSDGKDVVVERGGARLEPVSGQFLLNFETRELDEGVRAIPDRAARDARQADDWMAVALEYESEGAARAEAIRAYDRAVNADPRSVEAWINRGTLYYEDGDLQKAADSFHRALASDAGSALAHYNLGSVLEEAGQAEAARDHLREAVRLDPNYPDAHYNLAFVCEKLGSFGEARDHWQAYIRLDPASPWCDYARRRLNFATATKPR
jgi:tetratricopeptide (TPR) repeat protein